VRLPLVWADAPDGPATALVRPEAVSLVPVEDGTGDPLVGTVIATAFLGATSRVTVDMGDGTVLAQMPTSQAGHPAGTSQSSASAPLSSSARIAAPRWLQRCFSAGSISANVRPTSGTRNTGS
jgi:hypothetical protein